MSLKSFKKTFTSRFDELKVKRIYNLIAENYDMDMESRWQIFIRQRYMKILSECMSKSGSCLDIGCGTGFPSLFLAKKGLKVYAIDISKKMIYEARQKTKNSIAHLLASANNLCLRDGLFDYVTSLGALSHIGDLSSALREIHRVLKPSGTCVCDVFSKWTFYKLKNADYVLRSINKSNLVEDTPTILRKVSMCLENEKLPGFVYDSCEIRRKVILFFRVLRLEGIGILPSINYDILQKLPMEKLVELETRIAKWEPFINFGAYIVFIGCKH